jgi:membrane associated rhomboid family serine protease
MILWFDYEDTVIKIRFDGEDLYDLKQAVIAQVPLPRAVVTEVGIWPCRDIDPFSEDTMITELLDLFPNAYQTRWLLTLQKRNAQNAIKIDLSSFFNIHMSNLRTDYTLKDCQDWMGKQEWDSIQEDIKKIRVLSLVYVVQQLLYFRGFSLFSVSSALILANLYGYWIGKSQNVVYNKKNSKDKTSFLKSCFVDVDVNRFVINLATMITMLPAVERRVGPIMTALGYLIGCYIYKKAQTKYNDQNAIGATGAVIALTGSRMQFTFASIMERALFYYALEESFKTQPHMVIMFLGRFCL